MEIGNDEVMKMMVFQVRLPRRRAAAMAAAVVIVAAAAAVLAGCFNGK